MSSRLLAGGAVDPTGWRLPARALEQVVARVVAEHLASAAQRHALLIQPDAATAADLAAAAHALAQAVSGADRAGLRDLIASGQLTAGHLSLALDPATLAQALAVPTAALHPELLALTVPLRLRRRGVEARLVAGEPAPAPDPTQRRMLARAHGWVAALRQGTSLADLARRDGCSESYLRTRAQLAFLSPRIQSAILEGTQPPELSLERIIRTGIALDWSKQEQAFGFTA